MSLRAARHIFSTAARSSARLRVNVRTGSKRMNSSHAPKQSSDRPWVIGSALIFLPAFLYLVSPSARKTTHSEHHDSHDLPGHKTATKPEPVEVKDEEATEAVAEDAPNAETAEPLIPATESAPEESSAEGKDASSSEKQETTETSEPAAEEQKKSGTFQESGEEGPTDMSAARQAAKEGTLPKQKAEESSS